MVKDKGKCIAVCETSPTPLREITYHMGSQLYARKLKDNIYAVFMMSSAIQFMSIISMLFCTHKTMLVIQTKTTIAMLYCCTHSDDGSKTETKVYNCGHKMVLLN